MWTDKGHELVRGQIIKTPADQFLNNKNLNNTYSPTAADPLNINLEHI